MKIIIFVSLIGWTQLGFAGGTSDAIQAAFQIRQGAALIRGAAIGTISSSGEQELPLGDAVSDHDLFEIGSVSKSFAGVALASLVLDQKIDLDAPLATYIPELAGSYVGSVTAKQLATHTARLVRSYIDASGNLSDLESESDLIAFLKAYQPDPKTFPPGKRIYSNLGFHTLGLLLARVEQTSYQKVIRQLILTPLVMNETNFITSIERPENLLQGYQVTLIPADYSPNGDLACAAGGIYSNLFDMMKFLAANIHPGDSPLGKAIQFSHQYGLGWDSEPGVLPIWKNGAMVAGFSSYLIFDPTAGKESGAIVLTNQLNSSVTMGLGSIALGLTDGFLPPMELQAVEPTLIATLTGSYVNDTGDLQIAIAPLQVQFLSAQVSSGSERADLRLFSIGDKIAVDSGAQIADYIQLSGMDSIKYFNYEGQDANNKPIYNPILFHKK